METSLTNNGLVLMPAGIDSQENEQLKKSRVKAGDCPTCGMKMFKVSGNQILAFAGRKKQMSLVNKNGKTVNDRCLVCHPIDKKEQGGPKFIVPKILIVEKCYNGDDESAVSDITLDRRLQQAEDENLLSVVLYNRTSDEFSKAMGSTKSPRTLKSSRIGDQDIESLTDSDNDDDGANARHGKAALHRSWRSINNNSYHNQVSLGSSARNRWGESLAGMDGDLSTGPRPLPPKRFPSGDGDKNPSMHQSLPSRITTTTVCNTTCRSSPQQRTGSPTYQQSGSNNDKIPRIIIPNSPTKKSTFFTPPWNPRNQSGETRNMRKSDEQGKASEERKEIFFSSSNFLEDNVDAVAPRNGSMVKEITLFGNSNTGPKPIPNLDQKTKNHLMLKASKHNNISKGTYHVNNPEAVKEIHVDLTSIVRCSNRITSPTKDVTPRTLKRQKALNMLVQMEQIFPPEHSTSVSPPKKVQRAASTEVDLVLVHTDTKLDTDKVKREEVSLHYKGWSIKDFLSSITKKEAPEKHLDILRIMTDMMWSEDSTNSRNQFIKENGMEVITTILWTEIMHADVQIAVLELLFALASVQCEDAQYAVTLLSSENTDVVTDSLLITMEQHAGVEEIQLLGCQVLCCISSEQSSLSDVNDGTSSGACQAVLTAMEAHRDNLALQEWGIRALYNQCVYSKHSETNKHTILSSKLENRLCSDRNDCSDQIFGGDVLFRVLETSTKSAMSPSLLLEWTCKLYKALSNTKAIAEMLSPAADLLKSLIHVVCLNEKADGENECEYDSSSEIIEATLSTISSLLNIEHNKTYINATDIVVQMLDIASNRKHEFSIVDICLSIVSKVAAEDSLKKETLVNVGAVQRIVDTMLNFPYYVHLQEACMKTLACLSLASEAAKQQLSARETLDSLIHLCERGVENSDSNHSLLHESMCTLIASLYSNELLQERTLRSDSLGMLRKSMERYRSDVRLQEVAMVALMNLSTGANVDFLLEEKIVEAIVDTMEINKSNAIVQKDACCALWNVGVKTDSGIDRILDARAIKSIVAAIQNHLEKGDVVEMACGCLWGLANNNDSVKQQLLTIDGGMETVAWILVIHSSYPSLQEKACGVLAAVSSSVCEASASSAAKCASNIVDAIRSNPKSLPVLQSGARFLRQIMLHRAEYANEIVDVVSALINAMKEHANDYAFQLDACNLLWTISEKSHEAKERILDMDGINVLMDLLDRSGGVESVENAALGAFKQLALSAS